MKLKKLIENLSVFDPEMDMDGLSVTNKGIRPYLQESSLYIGLCAFWGAFIGVVALGGIISLLNSL